LNADTSEALAMSMPEQKKEPAVENAMTSEEQAPPVPGSEEEQKIESLAVDVSAVSLSGEQDAQGQKDQEETNKEGQVKGVDEELL